MSTYSRFLWTASARPCHPARTSPPSTFTTRHSSISSSGTQSWQTSLDRRPWSCGWPRRETGPWWEVDCCSINNLSFLIQKLLSHRICSNWFYCNVPSGLRRGLSYSLLTPEWTLEWIQGAGRRPEEGRRERRWRQQEGGLGGWYRSWGAGHSGRKAPNRLVDAFGEN